MRKRSRASDVSRIASIERISEIGTSESISETTCRIAGPIDSASPATRVRSLAPDGTSCANGAKTSVSGSTERAC